ncbi:DUF2290 domain-containing protein [Aliarcobacter butzleri]
MITKSQMLNSIRKTQEHLGEINLLKSFIKPVFLEPNKDFNEVCLNKESTYEEIYLSGLQKQYYNIILEDYSYFQFNFNEIENREERIFTPYARYAFYPNPFKNYYDDLSEYYNLFNIGEINFEEYSQVYSEAKPFLKKVFVRYDFSCKQYKKIYHPTAHFHFGIEENTRIASDKFFSPLAFCMFIINMYYVEYMERKSDEFFNLENLYKKEFQELLKVDNFNSEIEYYCDLQKGLISIK